VILHSSDGQDWLLVELGIVEPVQKMDSAWPGGREADPKLTGELGVGAGHEGSRLLVANLDETNPVLRCAQRLDDAVDTIAG